MKDRAFAPLAYHFANQQIIHYSLRRLFLRKIQYMPNFIISEQQLITYSMNYLIPVIFITIILSLGIIITSIVIFSNRNKTEPTPADTIKLIVDQLTAIHKGLETILRNSVNSEI